ncbi:MAG: hypothetical protein ACYCZT_08930 [Thiobacillus sp.]
MTGSEFIRKVKALGKQRGLTVTLDASRGKGSHQTLYSAARSPLCATRKTS